MTMLHTSSLLPCHPPNFHSCSFSFPPFCGNNSFNSTKPFSYPSISWKFHRIYATHGPTVSLLHSTATPEMVETREVELEFVEVGYISDVHGLQGEMRVKLNTDFPEMRFAKPGKRWLRQQFSGRENVLEVELESGRGHPGDTSWLVKLSGIDSIEQAKQLVGSTFLANKRDRPELEEGEFYSNDLVGMRVILQDTGETVGTVVNVYNSGGNDLLQVKLGTTTESPSGDREPETSESGGLVWIPFVDSIVPVVDLDNRAMQISPPKGLLELNLRSNEKSKKERRQLEWRERKKFTRRLISAKKKLCELEQQHVFHGFRYGQKSQRNFLAEQIVSVNSNLLRQALKAVETPVNGYMSIESKQDSFTWKSGSSVTISEKHLTSVGEENLGGYLKHREAGLHLISDGKVATVLLLNNRKHDIHSEADCIDIDNSQNSFVSFLESLLLDKQTFMKAEQCDSLPIILISPAEDNQILENLFVSHDYFNFNPEKVMFLAEQRLPVVSCSAAEQEKNKVLMKSPWEILQSPIGSGGTIVALLSNNILEHLIEAGVEYIEVCSINERCLPGNPVFLGYVHSCEADLGILTFQDSKEFEDDVHMVLPVKSMKKLLEQFDKFPWQATLKSNSHVGLVNKEWVDVVPSAPNSYEFGFSIESLLKACSLDNACCMEVTD